MISNKAQSLCVFYRNMRNILTLSFCLFISLASAQIHDGFNVEPDTVPELDVEVPPTVKSQMFKGRPGKAALYSLILPGAGQVYNGKIWKVPLVLGGVGTVGYFMGYNSRQYRSFKIAYRERILAMENDLEPTDNYYDPQGLDPDIPHLTAESIRLNREKWDRYRQMTIFFFALTWIANSAEAFVDAHLSSFDISDDLSFRIEPLQQTELQPTGIGVQIGISYNISGK